MDQDAALRSTRDIDSGEDLSPLFDLFAVCLERTCAATAAMLDSLTPPLSDFARSAGWLLPGGLLTQWDCDACDEPHKSDVEFRPDGSYSYLCLRNGRLPLTRTQLQLYEVDLEAVLSTFAASIGGNGRHVSCYVTDQFYKIGFVEEKMHEDGWTLGFARCLGDPSSLSNILHILRTSFPAGPGLIATIGTSPAGVNGSDGYLFSKANGLFWLQENQIAFKRKEAARLLFGAGASQTKTGAKSKSAQIAKIRNDLIDAGEWPDRRHAQVNLIRSSWRPKTMGKTPARTSLPRNLREIEKADREGRRID